MNDSNENPKTELIKGGVELAKAAYGDALKPAAQEVGKALGTLGKAVNIALAPLRGLVWSWDKIEEYLTTTVERRLEERQVPKDRVKTPDPDVAVPAIEALRYSKLKENYGKLLATAMDSESAIEAHPAFVEILKQLTPDEARILEYLPMQGLFEPLADLGFTLPDKGHFTAHRSVCTLGTDAKCEHPRADSELHRQLVSSGSD